MEQVSKKSLGQLLHDKRVRNINRAYASYRLGPTEQNMNELLQEVIKLAGKKLRPQAEKMGDVGMEDHDDFSQKVAMTVFEKLPDFDRDPQAFYPWVMTIINFEKGHLYVHLLVESARKTPLTVQGEDGDEYDNPELYAEPSLDIAPQAPTGLDEDDRLIYDLVSDGYTQEKIAELTGVSVATVERRVRSLKDRFVEPTYQGGK
jgi:RNA polymerase sigma factor (sigma-70 family)